MSKHAFIVLVHSLRGRGIISVSDKCIWALASICKVRGLAHGFCFVACHSLAADSISQHEMQICHIETSKSNDIAKVVSSPEMHNQFWSHDFL